LWGLGHRFRNSRHQSRVLVVGSNIANMLLIAGFGAIAGGRLLVSKNLVDLDIPMLAIATVLFAVTAYDGVVTRAEAVFLLVAFAIYLVYIFLHRDEEKGRAEQMIEVYEKKHTVSKKAKRAFALKDIVLFVLGLALLLLGARFLVSSVIAISALIGIGVGVISMVAVAFGTSMPELVVAVRAGLQGKADVSLGNIFGSNVFNLLFVVGIPGVIAPLVVDSETLTIGLPVMIGTTVLFVISTLSNRVYTYEGAMYVLLYVLFLGKLAGLL
jgi:cation:H+ antiporter